MTKEEITNQSKNLLVNLINACGAEFDSEDMALTFIKEFACYFADQTSPVTDEEIEETSLNIGQNLFDVLHNLCNFTALESEQVEILEAVKQDNPNFFNGSKESVCKDCGNKLLLMSGTVYLLPDDEPYKDSVTEKPDTDVTEIHDKITAHFCEKCDEIKETFN